jgi:ribosomal protein S18 acetylase RimI-like enzyme
MKDVIIREFQPGDLRQVAEILASSFRKDLLKLVKLPEVQMVDFLIETGEAYPHPFPGYIVAESNGEILGFIRLTWHKQNQPRAGFPISKILHYGWLTTIKLLVDRFIFPEKPQKGACHVTEIAVKQQVRRMGIATKLLYFGKEIALKNGLSKYTLNVNALNIKAFNLYQKMGFKIEKRRHNLLARWLMGVKEWYFMSQNLGTSNHQST